MNNRVKELRKILRINQEIFSAKINISRSHFCMIENGFKNITNRIINDICREFNVNEEWLRFGTGEIFKEETFSLDKYAKEKGATNFDIELIKIYLDMPKELKTRLRDLLSNIN